ncbi:GLOBIN domain-containing protein [Mycena indigotica]|uniref:GLOBIN domain-containing protein n=1 Tax=Mycena indigotica TaxID=2126181 RepID=A0A8H6SG42_9AGAR|nr:GLOBIN domain-containing protein [Mycena indigotica]KAF7298881.1 GLOBIN domain-containing protein [Mycena indigotica]
MKAIVQKENHPVKLQPSESHKPRPQFKLPSQPLQPIHLTTTIPSAFMPHPNDLSSDPYDGPLTSTVYFISPITTILAYGGLEGDHISVHDLIEAYSTLSNRIRTQIRPLLDLPNLNPPALLPLKECSSQLSFALKRDLKRSREQPFDSSYASWSPLETSLQKDADELRLLRDNAELEQHVLRFVSEIFAFVPLFSLFSTDDLRSILEELIILGTSLALPNSTAIRTWTFIVWTISAQNLPPVVLNPLNQPLASFLKRAFDNPLSFDGQARKEIPKAEVIKACSKLLQQDPVTFLGSLSSLFIPILEKLVVDGLNVRLQAVNALGRFALATLDTRTSSRSQTVLNKSLVDFLTMQSSRGPNMRIQAQLQNLINQGLATSNPSHPAISPFWVVQLLACVVVILKESFFSNPAILKLTCESLRAVLSHKQNIVIGLHPHVWKCLIWVFSHLPVSDTREAAFKLVKQEIRSDIPFAFISTLLGAESKANSSDSVPKVLEIVEDMLTSGEQKMQATGIAVVTRLLYVPPGCALPSFSLLSPALFDGTLLHPSRRKVIELTRLIPRCDILHIRQLAEEEVLAHWDDLANMWRRAVLLLMTHQLDDVKLSPPHLSLTEYTENLILHGWQTLLLMPTEITQGHMHFTPTEGFSGNAKFTALMQSFLDDLPADPITEVACLQLLSKMWRGLCNAFEVNRLAWASQTVLGAIVKHRFTLTDAEVKSEWAQMCSALMAVGNPNISDIITAVDDQTMPTGIQQQLWSASVASAGQGSSSVDWQDLAHLLSAPLGVWSLSKEQDDQWETLLRTAVTVSPGVQVSTVVEHVILQVGDWRRFLPSLNQFATLISFFDFEERTELPIDILNIVVHLLDTLYSSRSVTSSALQLIRLVRDFFTSCPVNLLVPLVSNLIQPMCRWLRDEDQILDDSAQSQVVNAFFTNPLNELAKVDPTLDTLRLISPLLETLADPDGFEKFWAATYHGRDDLIAGYPSGLKTCLKAFTDVFGGSLARGLSLEPHSQMEDQIAFDSQQPFLVESQTRLPVESQDYFADASHHPAVNDTIGLVRIQPSAESEDDDKETVRPVPSEEQLVNSSNARWVSPPVSSPPHMQSSPPPTSPVRTPTPPRLRTNFYYPAASAAKPLSLYDNHDILIQPSGLRVGKPSRPRSPVSSFGEMSVSSSQRASPWRRKRPLATPSIVSPTKRRKLVHSPDPIIAGPSRVAGESFSEPTSRRQYLRLSPHARSEPAASQQMASRANNESPRFFIDCVEVPTYAELRRSQQWQMENSLPTPAPSFRSRPASTPVVKEEEEDYGSWEASLSMSDVRLVQESLADEVSFEARQPSEVIADTVERRPQRSATEPTPHTPHDPPPLRRNQTSGVDDALERAYEAVVGAHSQTGVDELLVYNRWVNQIGAAVNERLETAQKKVKKTRKKRR